MIRTVSVDRNQIATPTEEMMYALGIEKGYERGRADERKRILEHQTVVYDLDGIGHKVVLVKDIKE